MNAISIRYLLFYSFPNASGWIHGDIFPPPIANFIGHKLVSTLCQFVKLLKNCALRVENGYSKGSFGSIWHCSELFRKCVMNSKRAQTPPSFHQWWKYQVKNTKIAIAKATWKLPFIHDKFGLQMVNSGDTIRSFAAQWVCHSRMRKPHAMAYRPMCSNWTYRRI